MKSFLLLLGALCIPRGPVSGQSDTRPEILILGTYHMANPGHDVANMRADDVLSARRQRELTDLVDVLKRFRPTRIAVEAPVGSRRVTQEYADYRAGTYALTRNEIDQIGYRLASELDLPMVDPVDVDGEFQYYRVRNYAKANGRTKEFEALDATVAAEVATQDEFLRSHTVLAMLEYLNDDAQVARDVASYYAYVPFGEPYEYAGPDLIALWFQRNIRIYRNITALIESPNDRILVIYGSGHLGWLRQDVANDPRFRLRRLSDLTGRR